jgi:hypothetical protein
LFFRRSWEDGGYVRISIVVTGSDGEVDTSINSSVDNSVQGGRLSTSQRHVGSGTLELGVLLLNSLKMGIGGILNTLDDIGHGSGSVRSQDLDGNDLGLLGDTILLSTDSSGTVSSVSVSILIGIAYWDGLAPLGTALEVDVINVGTGVNNVDIDAIATGSLMDVLVEGTETKSITVRDTGKTPWSGVLCGWIIHSVNNRVLLDVCNLDYMTCQLVVRCLGCTRLGRQTYIRVLANLVKSALIEGTGIAEEAWELKGMLQASWLPERVGKVTEEGSLLESIAMSGSYPVAMLLGSGSADVVLEDNDVLVWNLLLSSGDRRE